MTCLTLSFWSRPNELFFFLFLHISLLSFFQISVWFDIGHILFVWAFVITALLPPLYALLLPFYAFFPHLYVLL